MFSQMEHVSKNILLNITGGYKATIPYLTLMGQIYNLPIYYTFEETPGHQSELIRIPQAPIAIDWGLFEKYSHIFQQAEAGIYDWTDFRTTHYHETDELLVHSCIDVFDINGQDVAELSPIGRIFWNRYNNFYSVQVLSGSNYFAETDKTLINRAIRELCRRVSVIFQNRPIDKFESYFLGLHDQDIKKVRIGQNNLSQVYKHSNPQIRLHYIIEFSNTGYALKIINFRHRRDNPNYAVELTDDYNSIMEPQYTTIAIRK